MERRVAGLFFFSGMSGLVFEVIWVRSLGLWVGQTTIAVSLVVAAFLTGLVAGSYYGGRLADRAARPLQLYGLLELSIGVTALGVTLLLSRLSMMSLSAAFDARFVRIAVSFALLFPPTFAMGATLPVLTRFLTRDITHVGRSFGTLYAVNTFGAGVGCGLAGFVLIGAFGILRTALIAVALNFIVGVVAILWDRGITLEPAEKPKSSEASKLRSSAGPVLTPLHGIAFATGFGAIACEILWFRVLRSFIESSTYAFTLLLVTFLIGLVAGGALFARRLAGRPDQRSLLSDVQVLLAFAGLTSIAALGASGNIFQMVAGTSGRHWELAHVVVAIVVIFVPAMLMGISYPLVAQLGARDFERLGRSVGELAAANTIGGVLASLGTGLWFIPLLGTQRCLALAFTINLGIAIALGTGARRRVIAPVVFVVCALLLPRNYLVDAIATNARADRLAVTEGRDGTLQVYGFTRKSVCRAWKDCAAHCRTDFEYQTLKFGSMSYASTLYGARRYMRSQAHLAMLFRPQATRALEVCFGTGTTAASFAAYPHLKNLTIVDINADVFGVAQLFRESNRDVLADARVHPVVEDGRHFLATTASEFDVISFEPPPPTADGAASLYTTEFYTLALARLSPGGILAQWIPFAQQNDLVNRGLLQSMLEVFREVHVYFPSRLEGVVLASDHPMTADLAAWQAVISAHPSVFDNLEDVSLGTPEALIGNLVLDAAGVRTWIAGAPAVTDDLPVVEYFRSRGGPEYSVETMLRIAIDPASIAHNLDPERSARLSRETAAVRLQMRAEEAHLAGRVDEARTLAKQAREMLGESNRYAAYLTDFELDCLEPGDLPL
jgi:predicted membrane-bound spermidine synthase